MVCNEDTARRLSKDGNITVRLVSFGQARTEKGFMPMATVPAARQAMERAGLKTEDIPVIKTHNPFALNDLYFAKQMGVKWENMNNYGSPLVWGHPQGPTGLRVIMEVIEELAEKLGLSLIAAPESALVVALR